MEQKLNTVLVTGAAGLIGGAVVRHLLNRSVEVLACDNFSIGDWQTSAPNLLWEKVDIATPEITSILDKYRPNAVIHCAAHPGGRSIHEPVLDVEVNALGSMRIFDWCARNKSKVVYLSSSAVYGNDQGPEPIKETATLKPGTIYAACKIACENYLQILKEGYGLNWTCLRLFATYGAGHKPSAFQGIVNVMLTQLLNSNRVVSKGSLARTRDLIYVEDAARLILMALDSPNSDGQIINGATSPLKIGDLIRKVAIALGKPPDSIEIVEEDGTVGDTFYNLADTTKARELLGFKPEYSIDEGLTDMVRHLTKA